MVGPSVVLATTVIPNSWSVRSAIARTWDPVAESGI